MGSILISIPRESHSYAIAIYTKVMAIEIDALMVSDSPIE
jgi:hypothetical protein